MEWSSAFEALNELQKLHEGKSARLSIAEITSAVINLQDAQRNLPPQQFEDVYALFNTFQLAKRRFELPSMAEYYIYAVAIVKKFDRIAPYELYSGVTIHSLKRQGPDGPCLKNEWVKSSDSYSAAITQDFIDGKGISGKQTRQGSHLINAIAPACFDIALYRRVITGVFFTLELA